MTQFHNSAIINTVLHIFIYYFIPEGIVNKFQDFLIRREIWRLELTAETVRVGRSVRRQKLIKLDRIVESWFRGITLCVAFFTWNLEPFSSRIDGRSDDSVLPFRLVLLHCLVRWMLNFSNRAETSRNERQRHQITIFILYDSFCSFYVIPSLRHVL